MLRHENAEGIAHFIFEHIICRWGSLREIVMDNGPAFLAAQYDIHHITISLITHKHKGLLSRDTVGLENLCSKLAEGWKTSGVK